MKLALNQCTLKCGLSMLMGIFFLAFGLMKVMPLLSGDPQLTNMITQILPVSGLLLMLMAWGVVAAEVVGGAIVLGKKWAPKCLYQLSLVGFFVITLVGTVGLHIPSGNLGAIGMHVVILAILGYLLHGTCACKK